MCSGKSYGYHLYDMKNRKACVLDIDMKLPSVMACKVLCRYVDTICSVRYTPILSIFVILVINLISFCGFPMYVVDLMTIHVSSFVIYVSGLCNLAHWAYGMSMACYIIRNATTYNLSAS
jgi:hypothetical protein